MLCWLLVVDVLDLFLGCLLFVVFLVCLCCLEFCCLEFLCIGFALVVGWFGLVLLEFGYFGCGVWMVGFVWVVVCLFKIVCLF